jgi:tungstate transport system substrate-binding protein
MAVVVAGVAVVIALRSVSTGGAEPRATPQNPVLKLATTTSTADSGLLKAILPDFERACGCRVDVVAVGTGQALEIGRRGDADVLLVHAPAQEAAFMKEGHAARRDDVMYNDFVIVGPAADPAGVMKAPTAKDALLRIRSAGASFASRGDKSGTHSKELALWKSAGFAPAPGLAWYLSVGQGMGNTLTFANERGAYALTDRATWTAMQARLPGLRLLFGGASADVNSDSEFLNPYGVIVIDQARHAGVNTTLATRFADWLVSKHAQQLIGAFGRDASGRGMFTPSTKRPAPVR